MTNHTARIGMVNFINTAPIYETWKQMQLPSEWQLIEAPPSVLNQMLSTGEIDLGFVSSYEYCVRPEKYRILDDLSISASGSVGSVFLFSRVEPEKLSTCDILLSGQSDTSVSLVKIILEEFYHVRPNYIRGEVESDLRKQCAGVLAIGDEALRLVANPEFPFKLDLADCWCRKTALPFVFAVCAVREDYLAKHPETVYSIHDTFLECRSRGNDHLESICQLVAPRIPMHPDECYTYLRAIEYDLGAQKKLALERFFGFLIKREEGAAESVPIKYVYSGK